MTTPLEIASAVVEAAAGRADEVRVVAAHQRSGLTRFAESHVHQHVGEDATSVTLTLVRDGRVANTSTTDISAEGQERMVARALEVVRAVPADAEWPGLAGAGEVRSPDTDDDATAAASGDDRVVVVKAFIEEGGGNAAGYCDTEASTLAVVDSAGAAFQQRQTRATLDGIHRLGSVAGSGHQTSTRLDDLDGALAGAQARRLADLGSVPAEFSPGRVPVVLAPEAVSTLAIFLGFYGFNAKQHLEGQSGIRLGEAQFDEAIDLLDDPFRPDAVGIGFDAEGTPKAPLALVEAGTAAGFVHDRRTAAKAGATSTGHGLPGSAGHGPITTNLAMVPAAGSSTIPVSQLAAGMEHGLLVTAFNYCRIIDPKAITVTGLTRNGTLLVRDGRVVGGVGNLRFTQSFLDGLGPGSVVAMGDDARLADGEFGPAMATVPSLHLRSWNFTGDVNG